MTQLPLFASRPTPDRTAPPHSAAWWSWVLDRAEAPTNLGPKVEAWNRGVAQRLRARFRWT